jgi:hypothetical protein
MTDLDVLRRGAWIAQSRLGCGLVDRGSISSRDKGLFSSPKHPDQFHVPSSFLFDVFRGKAAGT